MTEYERGVEVVASALITNGKGQVLLTEARKWKGLWLPPGGHIDPGESVFDAACREGEEETGLKLKARELVNTGELVNDPDFNRKAHFIFFHVWCEVVGGELKIDKTELSDAQWFSIDEAIAKVTPGDTTEKTLKIFKDQKFTKLDSRIY